MGQLTVRVPDDLVLRVKRHAEAAGKSMNEWVRITLDAATNSDLVTDEHERVREKLRAAGLLWEPDPDRPRVTPPDPDRLAAAMKAAGQGTPGHVLVAEDRGE